MKMTSNTWIHHFPNLRTRASQDQLVLLRQSVDPDSEEFQTTLSSVAEIIFTLFCDEKTKLWELFPSVPKNLLVDLAEFDTRVRNALRRHGYEFIGNVLETDLRHLLTLQQMGRLSVVLLLRQLLKISLAPDQYRLADNYIPGADSEIEHPVLDPSLSLLSDEYFLNFSSNKFFDLNKMLNRLALFEFYGGNNDSQLIYLLESKDLERDKVSAPSSFTSKSWLEGLNPPTITELCDEFLDALNESQKTVIRKRLAAKSQMTLDQVGELLEVTRERARQIQKSVIKGFEEYLANREIFGIATDSLRQALKTPRLKQQTLKQFADLKSKTSGKVTTLEVLLGFGLIEERESLLCADFTYFDGLFAEAWANVGSNGLSISEASLVDYLTLQGASVDLKALHQYLIDRGYSKLSGSWFSYRGRGILEASHAVLAILEAPLTPEQIMQNLKGDGRTARSLQNAMAKSSLFVRISKTQWGLKIWGMEPYDGIREAIQSHLDDYGSVQLDVLEKTLESKFRVSRKSVAAYAQAYPFKVVDGWVSNSSVLQIGSKPVEATKRLYFTSYGVSLRLVINSELLRGSSPNAPKALCSWLGIKSGEAREFESDWGKFVVSNVSFMATMTSVKKLCDRFGLVETDELLLGFDGKTVVCRPVRSKGDPETYLRDAFSIASDAEILHGARYALRLESDSGWLEIKQILNKRKEPELVTAIALLESGKV